MHWPRGINHKREAKGKEEGAVELTQLARVAGWIYW
jgi:hypothetical protein